MLHLFPLISARRLNPQTHEHTNTRTNERTFLVYYIDETTSEHQIICCIVVLKHYFSHQYFQQFFHILKPLIYHNVILVFLGLYYE